MSEKIVHTHNIFIDTSRADSEGSKGDDFELHLNTQSLDARKGQFIRLTLNDFTMYKNFTDINENNSAIVCRRTNTSGTPASQEVSIVDIAHQNYETIHDLATDFADKLATGLATVSPNTVTATVSNLVPDNTTTMDGTTDNIISFTLTFSGAHGFNTSTDVPLVQCYEEKGDSYQIIGGNKIVDGTDITTSSITITQTSTTVLILTIQCLYPAQRSSTSHVYLRTSLTTGATETASLSKETVGGSSEAVYSNILARIPVNTEFCSFASNTGREYFNDFQQKHINNVRLYLTDQHNRRLGRRPNDTSTLTATGTGTSQSTLGNLSFSCVIRQSTLGNLSFSCVIRVDIIEQAHQDERFTPDIVRPNVPRMNNLLIDPSRPAF
jgi:hypothetical protein